MTLQAIPTLWLPAPTRLSYAPPSFTSTVIDATGEQFAWIGPVWNKDSASKNITKVGFLPGTVTSGGGSQLRLSLQNVDAATGAPARPDGVQDQTVDFLVSALTSNTWYQTAALSATRSVSFGEMLAVVLEYDAGGRLGSDAVNVNNLAAGSSSYIGNSIFCLNTAGWVAQTVIPNIILEFDDGTFGTLLGGFPTSAINTHNVNTGTTPDEVALAFQVPIECKVASLWANVSTVGAGRNFDFVLYQGTTAIKTVTIDAEQTAANASRLLWAAFAEETLSANTQYYLAVKPGTASSDSAYSFSVNAANHLQAHAGGTNFNYASRTDAGAWSATTTQRLFAGVGISAVHDGAGGAIGVIGG